MKLVNICTEKVQRICTGLALTLCVMATPVLATEVNVKTWQLPDGTLYPHDPLVTRDGAVWYTGTNSNNIGRFDPKTETFQEWFTDIPNSGPHGLKEDKDGNIWFTAIHAMPTYIGKFNPKTEEFTEYPVTLNVASPHVQKPEGAHSLSFDQDGILWFSMYKKADMIGRLDPATGKITLGRATIRPAGPYGIQIDSKGTPWYTLNNTNKLISVDPDNFNVKVHEIPVSKDARPRRLRIDENDIIWYTDWARGFLGRYDPSKGSWKEWPTPGGDWARPYPIALRGDAVWFGETWKDPATIVRFDIKKETFESWPVENCFDGAYYFDTDKDQNIWFTCHDTNRIGVVEISGD